MSITFENAISAIGLLGIGGLLGTYVRILLERRTSALSQKQEFKDTRYKCIIMLMYVSLDFEQRGRGLEKFGRNFRSRDEVLAELQTEWHNMILFASDDALKTVHSFIQLPSPSSFKSAALAMRKDLWGGRLSGDLEELEFDSIKPAKN